MLFKQKIDLYGQLTFMLLSLTPFLLIFSKGVNYKDVVFFYLYHALFLIVLGVWQVVSTVINYRTTTNEHVKKFLKNNLLIAFVYLLMFTALLEFNVLGKIMDAYLIGILLIADVLVIRYWLRLKNIYQL